MLLVAYGPLRQEEWILNHMDELPAKFYIGLGGTFDYIAGKRKSPPAYIRRAGLEWFYRLATQPKRYKRILQATFGLMAELVKYKVQASLPYRKNVVNVVINQSQKILICRRRPGKREQDNNHWMFSQGGVEAEENLEQAARRELLEETGITSVRLIDFSKQTNRYFWPFGFSKEYCGQKQSVAYWQFTGNDGEINLHGHETLEFIDFRWVSLEKLSEIVHEYREPLVQIVQQDFPQVLEKLAQK